ncbi:MAG: alkaline phosphatase [Sphingomonadales bacterium]
MDGFTRRSVVTGLSAAAAWSLMRPSAVMALTPRRFRADPFALGVASGEPVRDGFVLWTRLVGDGLALLDDPEIPVGWEVAEDEGFRRIVHRGGAMAVRDLAHSVHAEVAGLMPGRPYWYRFHVGGAVSPAGRTLTVPERPERLNIALTSCQHWECGYFGAYRDMIDGAPDLIVHVGDYIYESPTRGKAVRPFGTDVPEDLAGYRARHALYKSDADLRAAHAAAPWLATWDDHEVLNDYASLISADGASPEAFGRRRAAAYQAYFEHMPLRPSAMLGESGMQMYRRLAWGDLATFHVLDGRQYRSDQACPLPDKLGGRRLSPSECAGIDDPGRTLLGAVQERWLDEGLAADKARWSVLAQQTAFSPLDLQPGEGTMVSTEGWDGYGAARRRLNASLQRARPRNAVFLGGDVHSFWASDVKADFDDPTAPVIASEFLTSALAGGKLPPTLYAPPGENPHVRFGDTNHQGYMRLSFDRRTLEADMRMIEDQTVAASPSHSLARFVVPDGRPGPGKL